MDGIAMILDDQLRITGVGEPNWERSFDDKPPHESVACAPAKETVLGRPVTDFIVGDTVRDTFAALFNSVLGGARPIV